MIDIDVAFLPNYNNMDQASCRGGGGGGGGVQKRRCLGRGLRVGGPGKPPFWRTLEEFCSDGVWDGDYEWGGVRVSRPFGARWKSSVRYGTRLGDLKESCFILFFN